VAGDSAPLAGPPAGTIFVHFFHLGSKIRAARRTRPLPLPLEGDVMTILDLRGVSTVFLLAIPVLGTTSHAADLTKVDRSIAKEPAYESKDVRYCLLVFGEEAKTRVWLVQDGVTLYVDCNGNGDLTEEGERIAATKGEYTTPAIGRCSFEAGDIIDGPLVHKNLRVEVAPLSLLADGREHVKAYLAAHPGARSFSMMVDVEMPGRKGAAQGDRVECVATYCDADGFLQFSDKAADAPIIHFGGPLTLRPFFPQKLTIGRETHLILGVGTLGLGPGTTAYVGYENLIPDTAYPKVEIVYPPRNPGEPPVREHYELKGRC
jgi:hypothetical protein